MALFLESLILKGYRGFEAERVTFDNPTFFVGQNGSGKTTLADAILFLSEIATMPLHSALRKRGGIVEIVHQTGRRSLLTRSERKAIDLDASPFRAVAVNDEVFSIGLAVEFGPLNERITGARYGFEVQLDRRWDEWTQMTSTMEVVREQCILKNIGGEIDWFDRSSGMFQTNVSGLSPNLEPGSLGLPVVGGDSRLAPLVRALRNFHLVAIDPILVGRPQIGVPGQVLHRDGGNAASVLRSIEHEAPEDAERISEILRTIVPEIIEVEPRSIEQFEVLEFLEQSIAGRRRLRAESMSDGTLRALGLILAVFQTSRPPLIVIEEPEAAIHPGALGAIMDLIHHASRKMQVVVTTHSPDLLDAEWVEDRHLRVVTREEGSSRVRPISEGSRRILQKHLMGAGELFRSNALQADEGDDGIGRNIDLFVPIP